MKAKGGIRIINNRINNKKLAANERQQQHKQTATRHRRRHRHRHRNLALCFCCCAAAVVCCCCCFSLYPAHLQRELTDGLISSVSTTAAVVAAATATTTSGMIGLRGSGGSGGCSQRSDNSDHYRPEQQAVALDLERRAVESENAALGGTIDALHKAISLLEHKAINDHIVPPTAITQARRRRRSVATENKNGGDDDDENSNEAELLRMIDNARTENAALKDAIDGLREVVAMLREHHDHHRGDSSSLCWKGGKQLCYLYSPKPPPVPTITKSPSSSSSSSAAPEEPQKKEHSRDWAIMVTVNSGFMDFLVNWLSHYDRLQLGRPVYVVSEDYSVTGSALTELAKMHHHHSSLDVRVVDSGFHMTGSFSRGDAAGKLKHSELTSKKPGQILRVLEEHSSAVSNTNTNTTAAGVLFADLDTVWLDDPFPDIEAALAGGDYYDVAAQVDSNDGWFNTGFVAVPDTTKNRRFLEKWRDEIEADGKRSQPAFRRLANTRNLFGDGGDDGDDGTAIDSEFRAAKLPSLVFPSGDAYFNGGLRRWAKVAHACAIGEQGRDAKKRVLEEAGLWNVSGKYERFLPSSSSSRSTKSVA